MYAKINNVQNPTLVCTTYHPRHFLKFSSTTELQNCNSFPLTPKVTSQNFIWLRSWNTGHICFYQAFQTIEKLSQSTQSKMSFGSFFPYL